jgi:hypothetical protein
MNEKAVGCGIKRSGYQPSSQEQDKPTVNHIGTHPFNQQVLMRF